VTAECGHRCLVGGSRAEPGEACLRLADKFDGARLSSLERRQKSRYEGS